MKHKREITLRMSTDFKQKFSANLLSETPSLRKKFSHALCHEIKGTVRPFLFDAADALIQILNGMNHDLSLDEETNSDYLCLRYLHRRNSASYSDDYDFLVAFDLSVSVFFAENASNQYPIENDMPQDEVIEFEFTDQFSRFSFVRAKNDQTILKQLCNDLQTAIEHKMCEYLKPTVNSIIHYLNEMGHSLVDRKSNIPEIDFRDTNSGLHIGFYCIATVDYKFA